MDYVVVLVTVPSREVGQAIAQTLLSQNLAACISMTPVHSIYTWQGQVEQADEWQLLIKSRRDRVTALETAIQQAHPYEVPEIIAVPILAGFAPYLAWIDEQVAN